MKAYKFVNTLNSGRFSATSSSLHSSWAVKYEPGERSVPQFGKLMAFDTVDHAVECAMTNRWTGELWEAQVELADEPAKYIAKYYSDIHNFWRGKSVEQVLAPDGTLFCNWIEITRLIADRCLHLWRWVDETLRPISTKRVPKSHSCSCQS